MIKKIFTKIINPTLTTMLTLWGLLLVISYSLIHPQFVFAATPTISGAGLVTSYDPWVIWANGSNFTNPLRVRLYDNTATYWGDGIGVAYGSGNISFSLPSNMPPNACNYSGQCGISFDLVNNLGQASTRRNIIIPQYSGYACSRCSNNEGCTFASFRATNPGCTNPINGTISYTANQSCPRLEPPPAGGNNNRCALVTVSCNRCSANFGCTRTTFQSTDGCVNPAAGNTPTYTPDSTCPYVDPIPAGGNNNNCAALATCDAPRRNVGGIATSAPASVLFNNRLYMFIKGTDNGVYVTYSDNGTNFSSYVNLGGVGSGNPSTLVSGNTLYVLIRGSGGLMYQRSTTNGTTYTPWVSTPLSGTTSSTATLSTNRYTFSVRPNTANVCVLQEALPTCNRCSLNFGCTMSNFQSNDGCASPAPGTTPTYTANTSCPIINPLPAGGNNNNCAVSCSRCSNNFGCSRAQFQTTDACVGGTSQTANPIGTVTYVADPSCPVINPLPAGGNNNSCALTSCSRCSNNFGCTRAQFQTYDSCVGGTSQSAYPVSTVTYVTDTSCPRITTLPAGGNNDRCPATDPYPLVETFTAAPATTTVGNRATLTWTSNTDSCQITSTVGDVTHNSTYGDYSLQTPIFTQERTYRYTIVCRNSLGNSEPKYASVVVGRSTAPGASRPPVFEQTSGLIFNGGVAAPEIDTPIKGKLSERNWLLGIGDGAVTQYVSPTLTTSYTSLLNAQKQTKDPITNITCSSNTCTLLEASGVYHINNDIPSTDFVVNNAISLPNNRKVVVLVNGNIHLNNTIRVAEGGIFILAASGNITVDQTVGHGTSYACNLQAQLEGIYSTHRNFEIQGIGTNVCVGTNKDEMISIGGNIITNADLIGGGRFINRRDLCEDNLLFPAVSIRQRPDFIVNLPEFAKRQKLIFKEVSP